MKKRYTTIKTFIALLTLSAMSMSAQLSGLYTIDKTAPVSATNYTSMVDFATALNTLGVGGPVTANIVANTGPYIEQVQFNQITGASASNSIVINGNGNTLSFNNSTNAAMLWIMNLNGTDYLTVNNLTISGLGAYAYVVMLNGGADFNNFNNCTITCPVESTSFQQIPIVFSGNNTSYSSAANSGNNNTFTNCTTKWGYTGIWMYNMTGTPFNTNNKFIDCQVLDFYLYGLYSYYGTLNQVKGCVFERLNRTTLTTGYGVFLTTGNSGWMIEKNMIRKLYNANPGFGATCYGIYLTTNRATGTGTNQTTVRNNIVSELLNNGTTYGIFFSNSNGFVYHNTVAHTNLIASTGTHYGIYVAASTSYPADVKNNLTDMRVSGSGTKYPIYFTTTSGLTGSNNCWFAQNVGGTTFYYRAAAYANLAALQTAGGEVGSVSTDPSFISPSTNNFMPTSILMNDLGVPLGITDDINNYTRSATVPDMGAVEFLNVPCTGAPLANAVLTPTGQICANAFASLSFTNPLTYTYTGLSFQWQSSTTSSVGPFTPISGATMQAFNTSTTTQNVWYTAVITCSNGNLSTSTSAGMVNIAPTTTNTVPYFEGFEGITGANKLPNCSWSANNIPATCQTYMGPNTINRIPKTGSKFAAFYYTPANVNYFYTNGIYLNAGVTYSASMWYLTEYYGYTNWTDLSILYGTTQSPTGHVTIASSNGPAVSPSYKSLSNTFTVATSGLYYIAIRATASSAFGQYLSWDDLLIEAPCSVNNSSVTIVASTNSVCSGQPVTLTASGGNSYVWSTGATSSSIVVTPASNTSYMVTGVNPLTTCSASAIQNITVLQSPQVQIISSQTAVCKGSSVNLTAFGAGNYNWSNGAAGALISVSPSVATTYTVIGSNTNGCSSNATFNLQVKNLPSINVAASNNVMCIGESLTLTASGANTYMWSSSSILLAGTSVVVSPNVSTVFNISGTDANGCSGSTSYAIAVNACTGLTNVTSTQNGIKVYPNPSTGNFTLEFANENEKTVTITDVTGRKVGSYTNTEKLVNVNISTMANGIYYVKIQSSQLVEVVKVVKN